MASILFLALLRSIMLNCNPRTHGCAWISGSKQYVGNLCKGINRSKPQSLPVLQNPDDMYAELLEQLDAVEGQLPLAAVSHIKPKDRATEGDKDKEKQQERERQKEREKAQAAKAQLAARGGLYVLICLTYAPA